MADWTTKTSCVSIRLCSCSSGWRCRRERSKIRDLNDLLGGKIGCAGPLQLCCELEDREGVEPILFCGLKSRCPTREATGPNWCFVLESNQVFALIGRVSCH